MKTATALSAVVLAVAACSSSGIARLIADPLPPPAAPLGRQIEVAPRGNYADIDAKRTMDTMQALLQGTTAEQKSLAREIAGHPEQYAPPVFFVLSAVLFRLGQHEDALFWEGAGQLRTRYDIARCADPSVADTAEALADEYTDQPVGPYVRTHPEALDRATTKVLDWDEKTPFNYDCRWINLHGLGAFGAALGGGTNELSKPEADWPALHNKVREEFFAERQKTVAMIRSTVDTRTGLSLMPADWAPLIAIRSADDLAGKFQADAKTGSLGFGFSSAFPTWPPSSWTGEVEIYPIAGNRAVVVARGPKAEAGRGEISLLLSENGAVVLRPGETQSDPRDRIVVFRNQAGDLIVRRDTQFADVPEAPVTRSWERGNLVAKIETGAPPPPSPPDLTPEEAVRAAALDPRGITGIFRFKVEQVGHQNGWMYLDSMSDYRDPNCLIVAVVPALQPVIKALYPGDAQSVWVGRIIRVQGTARQVKIGYYVDGRPTGSFYYQTQIELRTPVLQVLPIPTSGAGRN